MKKDMPLNDACLTSCTRALEASAKTREAKDVDHYQKFSH